MTHSYVSLSVRLVLISHIYRIIQQKAFTPQAIFRPRTCGCTGMRGMTLRPTNQPSDQLTKYELYSVSCRYITFLKSQLHDILSNRTCTVQYSTVQYIQYSTSGRWCSLSSLGFTVIAVWMVMQPQQPQQPQQREQPQQPQQPHLNLQRLQPGHVLTAGHTLLPEVIP